MAVVITAAPSGRTSRSKKTGDSARSDLATVNVTVVDNEGKAVEGTTVIIANARMTMRHKTIYSGHSPFEVSIPKKGKWEVYITDFAFDTIRTYHFEGKAGSHVVEWDGKDDSGNVAEDGIYRVFYKTDFSEGCLGTWARWNYSEVGKPVPIMYFKQAPSHFQITNFPVGPDTLNVYYHYTMHLISVENPFYIFCVGEGYKEYSAKVSFEPGKPNELKIMLSKVE
jgi:hypothetical protein